MIPVGEIWRAELSTGKARAPATKIAEKTAAKIKCMTTVFVGIVSSKEVFDEWDWQEIA